jgi:hypothetical protein
MKSDPIKNFPNFQQEFKYLEKRLFRMLTVPKKCLKGKIESFSGALVKYRETRSLYNNEELTLGKKEK